jgi:hypothetical protein
MQSIMQRLSPLYRAVISIVFLSMWRCFACPNYAVASALDNKPATFTRVIEEMRFGGRQFTDGVEQILLRNVIFSFDRATDNHLDQRFDNGGNIITITQPLELAHCTSEGVYWFLLRDMVFEQKVFWSTCKGLKIKFRNCVFKQWVEFRNCDIDFVEFENCRFENGFRWFNNDVKDNIRFTQCEFSINPMLLNNPGFDVAKYVIKAKNEFPQIFTIENRKNPIDVEISECRFILPNELFNDVRFCVNLSSSLFNNLRFSTNRVFVPIKFSQSTITNQFTCYGCFFNRHIFLEAFSFNTAAAKVQWSSFEGRKISIQGTQNHQILSGNSPLYGTDEFLYSTLITAYASLYNAFKAQGNRFSANACYVEWKDIETQYLRHILDKNYVFHTYFSWLMNIFLKTFCDYGTNPVKSLQWSLWVMFGFAGFYFFFPFQTGHYAQESFFRGIKLYMDFFVQEKTLSALFHDQPTIYDTPTEEHYQVYLQQHRDKLPAYFRVFTKQMYAIARFGYIIKHRCIHAISALSGEWHALYGTKRVLVSILIFCLVLATVIIIALKRLLDACTVSLNAFSTLGFGDIPLRGIGKYLAVLEGFIGWFLLSIFSVALISQVIH